MGFCVSSLLRADGSEHTLPFIDQCNGQLCSTARIGTVRNKWNQTLTGAVHLFQNLVVLCQATSSRDQRRRQQEFSVD